MYIYNGRLIFGHRYLGKPDQLAIVRTVLCRCSLKHRLLNAVISVGATYPPSMFGCVGMPKNETRPILSDGTSKALAFIIRQYPPAFNFPNACRYIVIDIRDAHPILARLIAKFDLCEVFTS